jgi:hypothetical protein
MHTPGMVVLFTSPVLTSKSHRCSGAHADEHGEMCSTDPVAAFAAELLVKHPFVFGKLIVCDVALKRKCWFLYVIFVGSLELHPQSFKWYSPVTDTNNRHAAARIAFISRFGFAVSFVYQ